MDRVEIVIKLSKQDYELACKYPDALLGAYAEAISKGVPLSKGHGRLIDADALGEKLHRYNEAPYLYALKQFENAPTIIEADK